MIPAGIERDKIIAEIKDEVKHTCHAHHMIARRCPTTGVNYCERMKCEYWRYKEYSTDIATAMELWEEMKAAGVMLTLQYHKNSGIGCRLSLTNEEAFFDRASMSSYAETEADAISGAWLEWKETP